MKVRKLTFTILFMLSVPLAANSDKALSNFINKPTEKNLNIVKKACKDRSLNMEPIYVKLDELKERPSMIIIQALLYLYGNCSDGAFAEDLGGVLGVDIFISSPLNLIEALEKEKADDATIYKLASSAGVSEQSPFVNCDTHCIPKIRPFYQKKLNAIRELDLKGRKKRIQRKLLDSILKAKTELKNKLTQP